MYKQWLCSSHCYYVEHLTRNRATPPPMRLGDVGRYLLAILLIIVVKIPFFL